MSPTQKLIYSLIYHLESGKSLNSGLRMHVADIGEPVCRELTQLLLSLESGKASIHFHKTPALRAALYDCLIQGHRGVPVLDSLRALAIEADMSANADLDAFIKKTPFLSLIIVLLFFFPAFLILLIGPGLIELLQMLGG